MTAEEAEILARNTSVDCKHGIELGYPCECCVASALRAAAQEARQEALEEAASLMDDCGIDHENQSSERSYWFAAKRIRALAEKDH